MKIKFRKILTKTILFYPLKVIFTSLMNDLSNIMTHSTDNENNDDRHSNILTFYDETDNKTWIRNDRRSL